MSYMCCVVLAIAGARPSRNQGEYIAWVVNTVYSPAAILTISMEICRYTDDGGGDLHFVLCHSRLYAMLSQLNSHTRITKFSLPFYRKI